MQEDRGEGEAGPLQVLSFHRLALRWPGWMSSGAGASLVRKNLNIIVDYSCAK
jgi:hypothetical protein